jgi:hypothetical protein
MSGPVAENVYDVIVIGAGPVGCVEPPGHPLQRRLISG